MTSDLDYIYMQHYGMADLPSRNLRVCSEEQRKRDYSEAPEYWASDTCHCTMRQRMIGDGCAICNPVMAEELKAWNDTDDNEWWD